MAVSGRPYLRESCGRVSAGLLIAISGRVSGVVVRNVKLDRVTTPIQLYQTNLGHPYVLSYIWTHVRTCRV